MSKKWLLDVFIREDNVILSIYNEETRKIEEHSVPLYFYGYIESRDPHVIARELNYVKGVEEVWVEKWKIPPYYVNTAEIAVFKTRSYRVLLELLKTSNMKNLRSVNTFPHPLVEALYRARLRPITVVKDWKHGLPLLSEHSITREDPLLDYVVIGNENGYYVLETCSEKRLFWNLDHLAEYITLMKIQLGFTDPYTYAKLVELEPKVKTAAYKWVAGGAFHPSEYFEWSRLSYTPLSLMNNVTIGKVLTTIEALLAREKKFIVDKGYGRREPWRSLRELVVHDRGGVVYQPKQGLYWNVCQVDFKSLYPNIIVRYNISGETVDRYPCNHVLELPWTLHSVCLDEEGLVPGSIKELIEFKDVYDKLHKESGLIVYERRKNAVKWILVASFGYLGYRNSLFGSVMAHEVVTSTSREIMRKTRILVERQGYRVIHAIVDSVFIGGVYSVEECECIKERIEKETGFKTKVEAHYTWLYIPRSLNNHRAVSNKYYGLLLNGSAKIKGVMAIRRDIPLLVKKAQLEALRKLFEARNRDEMVLKIKEANQVIDFYIDSLERGAYDPRDLVITRRSNIRERYKKPPRYITETSPPYRLIYVNNKLIPYTDEKAKSININKYILLLEKARHELPSQRDLATSEIPITSSSAR